MARIRSLKPEFFLDSKIGKKGPFTRLFFQGLWIHADREGRLEEDQERLKVQILPYDKIEVEELLKDLQGEFITRYEASGKRFIQINNFKRHQHPHPKEPDSEIPSPSTEAVKRNLKKRRAVERKGKTFPNNVEPGGLLVLGSGHLSLGSGHLLVPSPEALELAELLKEKILLNDSRARVPEKLTTWTAEADKLLRIDGRPPPEARAVLEWCQKDGFWRSNILSMGKFRKQYTALKLKMEAPQNGGSNADRITGSAGYQPGKYANLSPKVRSVPKSKPSDEGEVQKGTPETVPKVPAGSDT